MIELWISCKAVTGHVSVDRVTGIIVHAPPIWGRFKGQSLVRLVGWLTNRGWEPVKVEEITI